MTTAWAHFAQGRVVDALRTHFAGTVLAVVALGVGVGALIVAAGGRRLSWQPGQTATAVLVAALAGMVLVEWIIRMSAE